MMEPAKLQRVDNVLEKKMIRMIEITIMHHLELFGTDDNFDPFFVLKAGAAYLQSAQHFREASHLPSSYLRLSGFQPQVHLWLLTKSDASSLIAFRQSEATDGQSARHYCTILLKTVDTKHVDCSGRIISLGSINRHAHLAQSSLFRGL